MSSETLRLLPPVALRVFFGDLTGVFRLMLTAKNPRVAENAFAYLRKTYWDTLCCGNGWAALYTFLLSLGGQILETPPVSDRHAERAYLFFDQSLISGVPSPWERSIDVAALAGQVGELLALLYLHGGDWFRDRLTNNARGTVATNWIDPYYLRPLYAELLAAHPEALRDCAVRIARVGEGFSVSRDGDGIWYGFEDRTCIVFDYIARRQADLPQADIDILLAVPWRFTVWDTAYFIKYYLVPNGLPADPALIAFFEKTFAGKGK